jgi:hypothetical protein
MITMTDNQSPFKRMKNTFCGGDENALNEDEKVTFVGFRYIVEHVSVMRKKNAEMYLVKNNLLPA